MTPADGRDRRPPSAAPTRPEPRQDARATGASPVPAASGRAPRAATARRFRGAAPPPRLAVPPPRRDRLRCRAPRSATRSLLDRLVRGRGWIGLLGVLLIGLVALNVSLLKLNAAAGRNAERAKELRIQNAELRGERLAARARATALQDAAASSGS